MKKLLQSSVLLCIAFLFFSFDLPFNWIVAGSKPKSYEMGVTTDASKGKVGTIKSAKKKIDGFGTLMQTCRPGKFLGKKVKMTGFVKTENVASWASLWFRVDQLRGPSLAFDNMQNRKITGTTDWTKYEIILPVQQDAVMLAYGALIEGTGQVWFDNITFEIVDDSTTATGKTGILDSRIKNAPENLDFEK